MIFISSGLNSKHVVKNAERLQKWYDKGYLPKAATHDVMIGLFKEGKVEQLSLDRGTLMNIKKRLVKI